MPKVLVIISTGFEEIEAISIIDILRRAQIDVTIATINEEYTNGAHNIIIKADVLLKDLRTLDFDMVVLPGGGENTANLANSSLVKESLQEMKKNDKYVAAICAAPYVLHKAQVLNKNYTCYPSFNEKIDSANYIENETIVRDEKVITSQGPATAIEFSLELVKILINNQTYLSVKKEILAL